MRKPLVKKEHPEIEHYFGFVRDPCALDLAKKRLAQWEKKVVFLQ